MTEQEPLTAAVVASPDDDLPRLVLADWLEENGEAERAEFIRLQCRLWQVGVRKDYKPCGEITQDGFDIDAARRRERELLGENEHEWLAGSPLWTSGWQANSTWVPDYEWEWQRGFVEKVCGPWGKWYGVCVRCLEPSSPYREHCPDCGNVRTHAPHGPILVKDWPTITELVTGKSPRREASPFYSWSGSELARDWVHGWVLPADVFRLLPPAAHSYQLSSHAMASFYRSEDEARRAASFAFLRWAKQWKGDNSKSKPPA